MLGEPLDQLREQLDPGACRLTNLPGRIWLFGGKGSFKSPLEGKAESLRESFWIQTLNLPPSEDRPWIGDIDFPENYPEWWAFSGYDDLLTFERDACHLAKAIILFPESPGSLAELGALAVDDSIIKRLIVVVQSKYLRTDERQSFLNLGPLRRAETLNQRCVISGDEAKDIPSVELDAITHFVTERLPKVPATQKLRRDDPTHKLLLIADLVDLLLASKPAELLDALKHFAIEIDLETLERSVKLLEFFNLVRIEHLGSEPFYVRREQADRTWVDYTAKADQPKFDRSRFKLDCLSSLDKNPRKKSVLGRAA